MMNKIFLMAVTVSIIALTAPAFADDSMAKPEVIKLTELKPEVIQADGNMGCNNVDKADYNERDEKPYYGRYDYEDVRDKHEDVVVTEVIAPKIEEVIVEEINEFPSLTIGYKLFENKPDPAEPIDVNHQDLKDYHRKHHKRTYDYRRSMVEIDDRTAGSMPVASKSKPIRKINNHIISGEMDRTAGNQPVADGKRIHRRH